MSMMWNSFADVLVAQQTLEDPLWNPENARETIVTGSDDRTLVITMNDLQLQQLLPQENAQQTRELTEVIEPDNSTDWLNWTE